MFKWPFMAATIAATIGLQPGVGEAQQPIEAIFARPSQTLTFATHYVAHDAGFFQKEGLKVADRYLARAASPNAVLAGSADFTITTAPIFLSAAAQKQKLKALANLVRVNVAQLDSSQKVSLVARLLDPKDALTAYDDLFTDEFVTSVKLRARGAVGPAPAMDGAVAPAAL